MTPAYSLATDPLLTGPALWLLAGTLALAGLAALVFRARTGWLRALAAIALAFALINPVLVAEEREPLPAVVALVVDESASNRIDVRPSQVEAARPELERRIKALPGVELRTIPVRDGAGADGTRLFQALETGLADVPRERVGAVIALTDGLVHDAPADLRALGLDAPLHVLLTGRTGERDRRVEFVEAPRFGIVGKELTLRLRVQDLGVAGTGAPVPLSLRRDGAEVASRAAAPGQVVEVPLKIEHAGITVIEAVIPPVPGDLTPVNDRAVILVEGVREKLRVLLVSGEPHAGERTWRNLLKSDPSVDLVHFTILRPPDKQDGTPISELSLIAFPVRELFTQKIGEFDLIIFDRYAGTGLIPSAYYENIARHVRDGGALLVAAGPEYADIGGLGTTPLASVLPARPDGRVSERPYRARLTGTGRRHPVTRDLPGSASEPPAWGEWVRLVGAQPRPGTPATAALMSGDGGAPLLMLAREGKGRVGLLLSDHAWLWARGYDGGGPHLDLLRRVGHWLMKEPDLEEEALRATARGATLRVERRTLADAAGDVTVTAPSGATRTVAMGAESPGVFAGTFEAEERGLHRAVDGALTAFASVGEADPREWREVRSTPDRLRALADVSGGSVRRVAADEAGGVTLPRVLSLRAGLPMSGEGFLGVRRSEASVTRGVALWPLFAGIAGLALAFLGVLAAWLAEGRPRRRA